MMNRLDRRFTWNWISLAVLAYGVLFAPWIGSRPAPEVSLDLFSAWQASGSSVQVGLIAQFLIIYLMAALLAVWAIRLPNLAEQGRPLRPHWSIFLAAGLGCVLTVALMFQGARFLGAGVAFFGFVGLLSGAIRLWGGEFPTRQTGFPKAVKLWQSEIRQAEEQGVQVSILAGHSAVSSTLEEAAWIQKELRARDVFFPLQDGAWIFLWDTPSDGAFTVAQTILKHYQGTELSSWTFGQSTFPSDGQTIRELLEHAEFALQVAEQRKETWLSFQETVLPDDIAIPQIGMDTMRTAGLMRLRNAFLHARQDQQSIQGLVVRGAPNLQDAVEQRLSEYLRGEDQVATVSPGLALVVLVGTDVENARSLAARFQERLSKSLSADVTITPLNILLDDDFSSFLTRAFKA